MAAKKTFLTLSLIILITSICGKAMAATPAKIEAAIENGITWLVAQQDPGAGYWHGDSEDGDFPAAGTGLALIKLEERAFELRYTSPFDPCYPYKQNVEKGLAYLFSQMSIISIFPQPAGNPDTNGDGIGVYVAGCSTYETGIAMMAIAASRAPDRIVNSPGSPVNGWTYKKVLQNMVDYMAFGQCDTGSQGRGGWSYDENGGADNSNSGYAVEGLGYAESPRYGFNCIIPQFVKDELKVWIGYIQMDGGSDDGGSGYDANSVLVNILKTGNLIFQMTFVGIPLDDPNNQRALAYIERNWNDSSPQGPGWGSPAYGGTPNPQAMYCTANGLCYSGIGTIVVTGNQRDWYADFADALVNAQQSGGYWTNDPMGGNVLATEWALLTLEIKNSGPVPGHLELTKVDDVNDGDCVRPGRQITYTIDYNYPTGPNLPDINDVIIIDYLPAEVDFNSASPDGVYDSNSRTVTWPIGTLHPRDNGSVTLIVEVNHPQPSSTITNECDLKNGGQVLVIASKDTDVCCLYIPAIYVDVNATGANNGTSWQDAYKYLQDALKTIPGSCPREIRVAAGTYMPDCNSAFPDGSGDRNATFNLINNVTIYGGFPPGGGGWQYRNPNAYKTILSGDIGTPDVNEDNSYHVVTGSDTNKTAVLDGFIITAGNATVWPGGGGMYNSGSPTVTSSPTVNNCTFSGNRAYYGGGGMYNSGSPTVTNCTFNGNRANSGGGMHNQSSFDSDPPIVTSGPIVTNCTFTENMAANGGGMSNFFSSPTVVNCILWGNVPNANGIDPNSQYAVVIHSDVQGGWWGTGTGNITADPCFVNSAGGDLQLKIGSLCIDAGSNAYVSTSTDLAGNRRIVDGNGDAVPVVDMGAYERQCVSNCWSDLNNDCAVQFVDYAMLVGRWGQVGCSAGNSWCYGADVDQSGVVDMRDLAVLAAHWLEGR